MEGYERIARAIALSGKKKGQIATECNVANSAVTQWIKGDSKSLKPENLYALAKATGFSPKWLALGQGPERLSEIEANVEPVQPPTRYYEYPEISWAQAGMAVEISELSNVSRLPTHISDAWAGSNGYWLKVRGPSMTSQGGISFIEGMIILVAPGFEVEDGQFFVARLIGTEEKAFKQLVKDSGRYFMKSLNPSYPTIELDDSWEIFGRVVGAQWPTTSFV